MYIFFICRAMYIYISYWRLVSLNSLWILLISTWTCENFRDRPGTTPLLLNKPPILHGHLIECCYFYWVAFACFYRTYQKSRAQLLGGFTHTISSTSGIPSRLIALLFVWFYIRPAVYHQLPERDSLRMSPMVYQHRYKDFHHTHAFKEVTTLRCLSSLGRPQAHMSYTNYPVYSIKPYFPHWADLFLAHPISLYHDLNLWRLTKGQTTTARAGLLLYNLLLK